VEGSEAEHRSRSGDRRLNERAALEWRRRQADGDYRALTFVTPQQRHSGDDVEILRKRASVYEAARQQTPMRWSRHCRSWSRIEAVHLNPRDKRQAEAAA
jgi:hypothetical protein